MLRRPECWRWSRGASEGSLFDETDDTVVPPAAAVDDTRMPALLVPEKVEIVADELHLQQRSVDRHGPGPVRLLPQQDRRLALHRDRHDVLVHRPDDFGWRGRGRLG